MSEITEASTVFSTLKSYFTNLGANVQTPGTTPTSLTLLDSMSYDELLTFVRSQAEGGSGYSLGVAQEIISTAAAIVREVEMCRLKKTSIYINYVGQCSDEATFYDQTGAYNQGVLKGNPTTGSQS